jgi:hypothetical protein
MINGLKSAAERKILILVPKLCDLVYSLYMRQEHITTLVFNRIRSVVFRLLLAFPVPVAVPVLFVTVLVAQLNKRSMLRPWACLLDLISVVPV